MEDTFETLEGYESLVALTSKIFSDQLHIRSAGIDVRGWTPDRVEGNVQMRVGSDPRAAQEYMDKLYGPGRVRVSQAMRGPTPSRTKY